MAGSFDAERYDILMREREGLDSAVWEINQALQGLQLSTKYLIHQRKVIEGRISAINRRLDQLVSQLKAKKETNDADKR